MNVPLLNLRAQYRALRSEIEPKVLEILASQSFVLGPEVEALETELAGLSGTRFAVGVSSGTDALLLTLMALGIGPGDGVLTTPFTFFATAGTVARLGARPVFCDIDPRTFNIDPLRASEAAERAGRGAWGVRPRVLLPVHLYGQCADLDALARVASASGMAVVEDACQAVGADYPGGGGTRKAGSVGAAGALSFYPTKNLGGFGDAGLVLTSDEALYGRLKRLRVHGERDRYFYDEIGGNFRLDALQAAILRIKLRHLAGWQARRREIAAAYDRLFAQAGLPARGLLVPPIAVYAASGARDHHTYHQYVVRAVDRDRLQARLREAGIGTAIFYPLPLHLQTCFASLGYKAGDLPEAERASREVLALPVYPELTPEEQDYTVSRIVDFYAGR